MSIHPLRCACLALALACAFALTAAAGQAAQIQWITASPTSVAPGGQVTITVKKSGSGNCGARIVIQRPGDPATIIGPFGFGTNPRVFTHTFAEAGTYDVIARPKKKGNLAACNGSEKATSVTVSSGGGGSRPTGVFQKSRDRVLTKKKPGDPGTMRPAATAGSIAKDGLKVKLITGVQVKPSASSADFVVTTSVPARFSLHVLYAYPTKVCDRHYDGPGGTASIGGRRKHWETMVATLEPNRSYHFEICAETEKNVFEHYVGSFFTGRRTASVSINKVHIIDDGDAGIAGEGEMLFFFWVNGQALPSSAVNLSSGDTWNPNAGKGLDPVGETVRIEVAATEADDRFEIVPGAPGHLALMNASGGDRSDQARAKKTIWITPDRPGDPETFTKEFSILSDHNGMQFRVSGKIDVRVADPN